MSTPGTVRNNMITQIEATLTSKTRIPNPREIAQNNDNFLMDGYGIYIGPGSPADSDLGFHFSTKAVDIIVVLTEKIYGLENEPTAAANVEDSLHDDKDSIIDAIANISGIDSNMISLEYTGDDGGEFIFADKNNYLALSINFALQYKKDKTYCV